MKFDIPHVMNLSSTNRNCKMSSCKNKINLTIIIKKCTKFKTNIQAQIQTLNRSNKLNGLKLTNIIQLKYPTSHKP